MNRDFFRGCMCFSENDFVALRCHMQFVLPLKHVIFSN